MKTLSITIALLAGYWTIAPCSAQESAVADAVAELKRELLMRDQVIRSLLQRVERLEQALDGARPNNAVTAQHAAIAPVPTDAQNTAPQNQDVDRLRTAFDRTLIDRGAVTVPTWTLEMDSALAYSHSSSEALTIDGFTVFPVLIVGDIVSERVRRDTFTTSVSARLGLPWQTQLDVRVPYVYENSSRLSAAGEEHKLADSGLGDIEVGFSRPLWHGDSGRFDLLGALRWKSTTGRHPFELTEGEVPFGTGFDAMSASLTAVSAQDPLVLYGTLSYTNSLPARYQEQRINPGDGFGLQLGTVLAVNLDTSMSFGFAQQFTQRTRIDGIALAGSYVNSSSLNVGLSHTLTSGLALDTTLAIGLSEDSPDVNLSFSMPFRRRVR
jgi:hypothetical protein